MSEEYQLPEKWSEDAVDESGNKLSKRYAVPVSNISSCRVRDMTDVGDPIVLLQRVEEA